MSAVQQNSKNWYWCISGATSKRRHTGINLLTCNDLKYLFLVYQTTSLSGEFERSSTVFIKHRTETRSIDCFDRSTANPDNQSCKCVESMMRAIAAIFRIVFENNHAFNAAARDNPHFPTKYPFSNEYYWFSDSLKSRMLRLSLSTKMFVCKFVRNPAPTVRSTRANVLVIIIRSLLFGDMLLLFNRSAIASSCLHSSPRSWNEI